MIFTEFLAWPEKWISMRSKSSGITYWVKPMELKRLHDVTLTVIEYNSSDAHIDR